MIVDKEDATHILHPVSGADDESYARAVFKRGGKCLVHFYRSGLIEHAWPPKHIYQSSSLMTAAGLYSNIPFLQVPRVKGQLGHHLPARGQGATQVWGGAIPRGAGGLN